MPKKLTQDEVIERFKKIHGDLYDYSCVEYIQSKENVEIKCSIHGSFYQTPSSHIHQKAGCTRCAELLIGMKNRSNHKDFIEQSKKVHQNFYSYEKTQYISSDLPIVIICPIHGEFVQIASNHLHHKKGCSLCRDDQMALDRILTIDQFIERSNIIFDNYYDYSDIVFSGTKKLVKNIICPLHGSFDQNASNHLSGRVGCVSCKSKGISKLEKEIYDYIKSNLQQTKIIQNTKRLITPYELDIAIPQINVAIEFNGIYWHGELNGKDKYYHLEKTKKANDIGYRLIHIFENEYVFKKQLVLSRLSSILNLNNLNRIGARTLSIEIPSKYDVKNFLNENHLQGSCGYSIAYGLYDDGILMAVMTFGKPRYNKKYEFELIRFCNKKFTTVIGGASRLFKRFIIDNSPQSIISYSDIRWNSGDLYKCLGFTKITNSAPNYFYTHPSNRLDLQSRIKFQKHKLKEKLDIFDEHITEWENMKINGYDRIWDCGNMVFVWDLSN